MDCLKYPFYESSSLFVPPRVVQPCKILSQGQKNEKPLKVEMSTRVYFGRLARDVREKDLETLGAKYGKVAATTLKAGFGFLVNKFLFNELLR